MDDFDTDFKNPIGIFNLEMDQNWTYIWSTKWIIDLVSSLKQAIWPANPAPFPAGNFAPSGGRRDCVFWGFVEKPSKNDEKMN